MNLKAFAALTEAFAGTTGTPADRLIEAITLAGISPETDGEVIAGFIDVKDLQGTVPATLLDSYSRYSAVAKVEAEAEKYRGATAAALEETGEIIRQLRENIGRGVSPDVPEMAAKAAEASLVLAGLASGKRKPIEALPDFLKRKFQEDATRGRGELLGIPLDRFRFLARMLDGIQPGFYIVAAETNTGKTTFLSNIFLDALAANPAMPGLYVTLDDPTSVLVDRFAAILARLAFRREAGESNDAYAAALAEMNINALRKNLDHAPRMKAAKASAAEQLFAWAKAGRLDIRDITELTTGSALESLIRSLAKDGRTPFVVVDALYNLDIGCNAGTIREENIARAQFLKRLSDNFAIPIWTTAEIRKKDGKEKPRDYASGGMPTVDDIMESSKYAYNANAVFMLYPENRNDFFTQDVPRLVVDVQKNKLSDFKRPIVATFTKRGAFMELDPDYKPAKVSREKVADEKDTPTPFDRSTVPLPGKGKSKGKNESSIYKGDLL